MTDYTNSLILELRNLCHPFAEAMSDTSRIDCFVKYSKAAAEELERLRSENAELRHERDAVKAILQR